MESDDDIAYAEHGSHRPIARQKSNRTLNNAVIPVRRKRTSSELEVSPSTLDIAANGMDCCSHQGFDPDRSASNIIAENDFNLSSYAPNARSVVMRKFPVGASVGTSVSKSNSFNNNNHMFGTESGENQQDPGAYTYSQMNELLKTAGSALSGVSAEIRERGCGSTPISPSPGSVGFPCSGSSGCELDRPAHWKKKFDSVGPKSCKRSVSPPRSKSKNVRTVSSTPRRNSYSVADPVSKMRQSNADATTLLTKGFGLSWLSQLSQSTSRTDKSGNDWEGRRSSPSEEIEEADLSRSGTSRHMPTQPPHYASSSFAGDLSIGGVSGDVMSTVSPPFSRYAQGSGVVGSVSVAAGPGSASKSRGSSNSALSVRFQNICKRVVRDESKLAALVSTAVDVKSNGNTHLHAVGSGAGSTNMMDPRRKFRHCVELELLQDSCVVAGGVFIEAICTITNVCAQPPRSFSTASTVAVASPPPVTIDRGGEGVTENSSPCVGGMLEVDAGSDASTVAKLGDSLRDSIHSAGFRDFRGDGCVAYFKLDTNRDKCLLAGTRCRIFDPIILINSCDAALLSSYPEDNDQDNCDSLSVPVKKRLVIINTYLMEMM